MTTVFDQCTAAEARFRSESTTDEDRAKFYQRDLGAFLEVNRILLTRVQQQQTEIEHLRAEVDRLHNRKPADEETVEDLQAGVRRNMAELIRRGIDPAKAIANGVPTPRDFKPRIVK
jgi:predicted RNase H-like nuclease (RuvC/YqgF family)